MSRTHDIDNDDPFVLLHPYEPLGLLEGNGREPPSSSSAPRTPSSSTPTWYLNQLPESESHDPMNPSPSSPSKGKAVSKSLYMQGHTPSDGQIDAFHDLDPSSPSGNSSHAQATAWVDPSSADASPAHSTDYPARTFPINIDTPGENVGPSSGFAAKGKGKGRARAPVLPPLVFDPTALEYGSPEWTPFDPTAYMYMPISVSPQTAGPSSYGSGFASSVSASSAQSVLITHDVTPPVSPEAPAPLEDAPPRPRSLSSVSVRSTRSLSALSVGKVKAKLGGARVPGNIARKLLFKKRDGSPEDANPAAPPNSPGAVVDTDVHAGVELGRGSCFLPWARELKSCTSPPQGTLVDIDVGQLSSGIIAPVSPLYRMVPPAGSAALRAKGRSYSSPFPLPSGSPLDLVPVTAADISEPIVVDVPNYFDEYLPRELRLRVLAVLVELHEAEHARTIAGDKWSAARAGLARNRWVGWEKGILELLRLRRVSKAWKSLVYDGQLWARLPKLPATVLKRLCETGGGFIRQVDFAGLAELTPESLMDMTDGLCLGSQVPSSLSHTRVTTINLQGCAALTPRSLHYLLIRAPALQTLCVKGLSAVGNNTCAILALHCRRLESLDMSRCINLDGDGVRTMAESVLDRGEVLSLKVLRLNWLSQVTDGMMRALGRAAPALEVLDLSYAAPLHNSAIEAFVALSDAEGAAGRVPAVQLSAREAGRDPADPARYWRRVTRVRHLALSCCALLTDHACSHLAHAVPRLEALELAGIGPDLRDDGLVRLLETTPLLRKLDLEDAAEISDAVLAALTPALDGPEDVSPPARGEAAAAAQPGHALEHLVVSHAGHLTNGAFLALMRACPRLRVLEADSTRLSGDAAREFVRLARARGVRGAGLVAVDCRGVPESAVRGAAHAGETRPRRGWRGWDARRLGFLDARDEVGREGRGLMGVGMGQDECDEGRVVFKTFYSWQTVDAVRAAREKRRKATRRNAGASGSSSGGDGGEAAGGFGGGRAKWWPGRRSGAASPVTLDGADGRDGCTIM